MPRKSSPKIREHNFQNAQNEIAKVISYLEDIKKTYFRPMHMQEEINATNKANGYLEKVLHRLTKRIELSKRLNESKQD